MKTRNGFVSNSSSSSFIIKKKFVTGEQIDAIKNHIQYANDNNWIENTVDEDGDFEAEGCGYGKPEDAWYISETDDAIKGDTDMTNFSMEVFMQKLGVNGNHIKWTD